MLLIALYSLLLGITMKIADLTDEHHLRLFKGDQLLFGLLWGVSGSLLVFAGNDIANILLAMVLAFLIRMRLDYYNHVLAATLVILSFVLKAHFDLPLFSFFFICFSAFGFLRDYMGDVRKKKDIWYKINEPAWYYVVPPLIYSTITGNWAVSFVCIVYILGYDLTKTLYKGW